MNFRKNSEWQENYDKNSLNRRVISKPPRSITGGRTEGSRSTRERTFYGERIEDVAAEDMEPNDCYKLDNKPIGKQVSAYDGPRHGSDEILSYDCFMPTGEIYEYLPCAPYNGAADILGFKQVRGVDTIMNRYGDYNAETKDFAPYKLLLYRGRFNNDPEKDDKHRFIYLAQTKSGDTLVGDCFIRLEEVHNRMRGDLDPYIEDCKTALECARHLNIIENSNGLEKLKAQKAYNKFRRKLDGVLRFRCWAVEGVASSPHEQNLCIKLFYKVNGKKAVRDHIEEFRVWAEILRKSQGDKLASKDFFGRYWDAVIPAGQGAMFQTGFKIVVGAEYFQYKGLNPQNLVDRNLVREEVFQGVKRVIDAPRIKFRPPLSIDNVVFLDEAPNGWRSLETHPGGLYSIRVNGPVQGFLCHPDHDKPLWQNNYPEPGQILSELLQGHLDKCKKTSTTTTQVQHDCVVGARKGKRKPTQDRVVAKDGFSANLAMAKVFPQYYPDAAKAKKRRVAEWLHRSAFSYGGLTLGDLGSSQVPNNLVLGTPDTNTVMMRQGNIHKDHQYTWLAPKLVYDYRNHVDSTPHVKATRTLFPFNRETSMLFQSLLDKSLEAICWRWPCWDENVAVEDALKESTGVDDNEEENNQEELDKMLRKDLAQRDQQV
ncbi:hypothetical protein FOC1_g10005009 [Fusarium oxysporum f. sp. cubense race 1]|uniref:Uncharacterized protein n=1 Tax=Fusarium oxysporum f. sp. cubense (strain race 1) TaxID=1229664 RepID=N4UPF9_FUSC1|nr:hypothetical protein FOC1_g10005009 [Fusarium oxysporum f. sp. cubense race 1]